MTGGREEGAVLVELLVALAVLAVMSGLAAGMLGQMRSVGRLGEAAAVRAELAAAADHLARTISGARAVALPAQAGSEPPVFVGTPDGLRFVAVTRRGFDTFGLSEVTLAPRAAPAGIALVQRIAPSRSGEASGEAPIVAEAVVAEGLSAARFAYVDAQGRTLPRWSSGILPAGVRIALSRTGADREVSVESFAPVN